MNKLTNPLDDAWFVDNNNSTSRIITVNPDDYIIQGPREIIIKKEPYSNEDFLTYNKDGICECGQFLDQLWRYCPRCGGKLAWK